VPFGTSFQLHEFVAYLESKFRSIVIVRWHPLLYTTLKPYIFLPLKWLTPNTNELRGARTRRFITVFSRARHRSPFRANWIHSTPQPISLRFILSQSSHLRFVLHIIKRECKNSVDLSVNTVFATLSASGFCTCGPHMSLESLLCSPSHDLDVNYPMREMCFMK
jgi:hypothetical protein